jgi:hypothetical protein
MEYITDITENVKEYARSLGYEVLDSDLFILNHTIESMKSYICNKTNQKEVPEGLKYIWINRSTAEFLNFKFKMNQLDIEGLNFKRIAKEIGEGDTKVVFENTATTGDKFEVFLMGLQTYGEGEMLKYRRLVW